MSKGYVYILTNEHMPGLVKIGMTTRTVDARIGEIWQTGVPSRFKEEASVFSPDCRELEQYMHWHFSSRRVSDSREFFSCDVSEAIEALDRGLTEQVSALISDHLETHVLVPEPYAVDPSCLEIIGNILGHPGIDVAQILAEARGDDETVDFAVLTARWEVRKRHRARLKGAICDNQQGVSK